MDELTARAIQMLNARAKDSGRIKAMSQKELIKELMRTSRFYNLAQSRGIHYLSEKGRGEQVDVTAVIEESTGLVKAVNAYFFRIVSEMGRREGMTIPELRELEHKVYLENEF